MYCCLKFSKGLIDYKSSYSKRWDYGESIVKCIFDDRGSVFRFKRPIRFNKFLKIMRKRIKYNLVEEIYIRDNKVCIIDSDSIPNQGSIKIYFDDNDEYNKYAFDEFRKLNIENKKVKERYINSNHVDDIYKSVDPTKGWLVRGVFRAGLLLLTLSTCITLPFNPLISTLYTALKAFIPLFIGYKIGQACPFIHSFVTNTMLRFSNKKYLEDAKKENNMKKLIEINNENNIEKEINNVKKEIVDKTKKVNYLISKLDNESQMYYRRLLLSKMDLYISSMKDDNNLTLVNKDYSLIKYSTDLDMIISNVVTLLDTKSEVNEICDLRNEISSMVVDEVSDELEGNTLTLTLKR